jgi:hypothetical protein
MQPNPYKYQGIAVGKKTYFYIEFEKCQDKDKN